MIFLSNIKCIEIVENVLLQDYMDDNEDVDFNFDSMKLRKAASAYWSHIVETCEENTGMRWQDIVNRARSEYNSNPDPYFNPLFLQWFVWRLTLSALGYGVFVGDDSHISEVIPDCKENPLWSI